MPRLASRPDIRRLIDLYAAFPDPFLKVTPLGQAVMRSPESPLSPAERELIAAHVSALNGCRYCLGIHGEIARAFGVDEALLSALSEDPESAPVPERMRPILALATALTREPASVRDHHAEAIRAAGWDDRAVVFTVAVTAYFNMMNRLAEGFGLTVGPEEARAAGAMMAEGGYTAVRDAAAARAGIRPGD
ncbi:MAG: peroxidase [Alphaproteobacteria bacterium]|nr:MAG: peroxidase [Alphaproteobacteria bacterium]